MEERLTPRTRYEQLIEAYGARKVLNIIWWYFRTFEEKTFVDWLEDELEHYEEEE